MRARYLLWALPALLQLGAQWRARAEAALDELRASRLDAVSLAFAYGGESVVAAQLSVTARIVPALPLHVRTVSAWNCRAGELLPSLARMLRLSGEGCPARLELEECALDRAAVRALAAALGPPGNCALRSLALRAPASAGGNGG